MLAGFALVATSYGLARYSLGLLMPEMGRDLSFSASAAGIVSGLSFAGYCVAILAAPALARHLGARAVAAAAGGIAGAGLLLLAAAGGPAGLAAGAFVAGLSSGLVSPALAALVAGHVESGRRDAVNTTVNAGTGGGVLLAGPAALILGAEWRAVLMAFAAIALVVSVWALLVLPGGDRGKTGGRGRPTLGWHAPLAAFLMGIGSTAVWSFGGVLTADALGWTGREIGLLWTVIGAAGIAGVAAGPLVGRFGIDVSHRALLMLIAISIPLVGSGATTDLAALAGGAAFGAAFIAASGVYLLWSIEDAPDHPADAVMRAFLVLAIGQTIGAPLFGATLAAFGTDNAVWLFAALTLLAGYVSRGAAAPGAGRRHV